MKIILILLLCLSSLLFSADILALVKTLDHNDTTRFKTMVANTLDANAAREDNNKTVLMYAVWVGNEEAVEFLIGKGADVNAADAGGATALHLAIWKDRTNMALYLMKHGASIRALSTDGMTPMDIAALRQNAKVLEEMEKSTKSVKSLNLD